MRWLSLIVAGSLTAAIIAACTDDPDVGAGGGASDAGRDVTRPIGTTDATVAPKDATLVEDATMLEDARAPIDGGSCPEPSEDPPSEVKTRTPDVTSAVAAAHAVRPDLGYIAKLRSEYASGDGPYVRPFKTDTGYDLVLVRGDGDCPAGCTIHEYWYFEVTSGPGGFTAKEVGHYVPNVDGPRCDPDAGTPMWNTPPKPNCIDAGAGIPDYAGKRAFCISGVLGTCDGQTPTTRIVTADLSQVSGDAGFGTLTLHGIGSAAIDDRPFDAVFGKTGVFVRLEEKTGTGACIDTLHLEIDISFSGQSGNGTIRLETTHTTSCTDALSPPYCKAATQFKVVASSVSSP